MNNWDKLADALKELLALIEQEPDPTQRLYKFADRFLALAKSYHAVVLAEGKTSIRLRAAVLALTLSTPKSRIESFLEGA